MKETFVSRGAPENRGTRASFTAQRWLARLGEGSDNFFGIVGAHIAVSLFDVCYDDFPGRVVASPLQHISVFPHDVLRLFKDVHKDCNVCGLRLSDFYHSFLFYLCGIFL